MAPPNDYPISKDAPDIEVCKEKNEEVVVALIFGLIRLSERKRRLDDEKWPKEVLTAELWCSRLSNWYS